MALPGDWRRRFETDGYLPLGKLITDEKVQRHQDVLDDIIALRDRVTSFS